MWKEKNKTKCGLFAERGCRQRRLCRVPHAIALGSSGKNFPSSRVPNFTEHSCTGRSAKNFFKNLKTVFADGLCQVRSAQDFQKKKENNLCRQPMIGVSAQDFSKKKNKTPLFADSPCSRPSAKTISKTVNLTHR
jgi:hypothetical protein